MATVRINESIRLHVRREISALYAARERAIHEKIRAIDMTDLSLRHFGEIYAHAAQELNTDPKGHWVTEANQQCFQICMPESNGSRFVRVTIPYPKPIPTPIRAQQYNYAIPVPVNAPEGVKLSALLAESEQLSKECDALVTRLLDILFKCSTLKQVIEIWPSALDFMPPEVKEQHNKVIKPKDRTARTAGLAIDDATKASLLTARLLAGTPE